MNHSSRLTDMDPGKGIMHTRYYVNVRSTSQKTNYMPHTGTYNNKRKDTFTIQVLAFAGQGKNQMVPTRETILYTDNKINKVS